MRIGSVAVGVIPAATRVSRRELAAAALLALYMDDWRSFEITLDMEDVPRLSSVGQSAAVSSAEYV